MRFITRRPGLFRHSLLGLALALGPVLVASNGPAGAEDRPLRRAELLLFDSPAPDTISAGVYLELAPGWHLYWSNPGDAGLAPEVGWRLPEGYRPGPLRFPTPEKFVEGDLVVYGYQGEVLLLCDIKAPTADAVKNRLLLAADLDWMACLESCVLGRETLTADPSAMTTAKLKRSREVLARFAARYPGRADASVLSAASAAAAKSAAGWTIEIAFSGSVGSRVRDFYPHALQGFVVAYAHIACRNGRISIPVTPSSDSTAPDRVSGLLIIDNTGYEISLPVKRPANHDETSAKEVR